MKQILFLSLFLSIALCNYCQDIPDTYRNPILPGFHPDPSICRVGEDYYLVTSSFEWFPGIPVYRSRDLVNWEHIGYVLDRPAQLRLEPGHPHNGGVWAPTIRFHEGLFYLSVTAKGMGSFYVTATDPSGPWSDPVWLKGAKGIDPSLFWDDDGRCWYAAAANLDKENIWPGKNGVYIQELDTQKGELLGKPIQMTYGHAVNARWTEGPHIYKIEGKYLLLVAEGGTGKDHGVTVFKSDSITGPYTASHTNPVLTHRHLGVDYPLGMMGHADLVETPNGEWWAVLLGRRIKDRLSMLARETFLVNVTFEEGWPVFNPGIGKVPEIAKRPDLPWSPVHLPGSRDNFTEPELALYWNFLRTPYESWYKQKDGELIMQCRKPALRDMDNPSLIARRIQHFDYTASTRLSFSPKKSNEEAGLTLFLDNEHHYRLAKKENKILLIKADGGKEILVAERPCKESDIILGVEAEMFTLRFFTGSNENNTKQLGKIQDARVITAPGFIGDGFNGPYTGIYTSSNGAPSGNEARFDWFEYTPGKK